ncbi:hypothetical protein [Bermanella sp. R86510]|uniref:hypothetical protein n=1 Tax=unclassified Bermanella TaxID=2627862 RepID=UPI0037C6440D
MHYPIIIFVFFALFFALSTDDELSKDSITFINDYTSLTNNSKSKAYWFLMGLDAPKGIDPIEYGKAKFSDPKTEYKPAETPFIISCNTDKISCFEKIELEKENITDTLSEYQYLLENYHHFLTLEDYRTLNVTTIEGPGPLYFHLVFAHRLFLTSQLMNPDGKFVITNLKNNLVQLESILQQQDTLIGLMVLTHMYATSLDFINYFSEKHNIVVSLPALKDLTTTFKNTLLTEFMLTVNLYKDMDANPNFFEEKGNAPAWYIKLIFKPNMNINQEARKIRYFMDWLDLDNDTAFKAWRDESIPEHTTNRIRNFAGSALLEIASNDYRDYFIMGKLLNAKIALSNDSFAATHPFSKQLEIIRNEESVCFEFPDSSQYEAYNCIANVYSLTE